MRMTPVARVSWLRMGAACALLATIHAPALRAQDPGPFGGPRRPPEMSIGNRASLGATLGVVIPQGELSEFAGTGVEVTAHLLLLNQGGWLGLRVSGSGALYDAVDSPVGGVGRLSVRSRTGTLDVGPQVMASRGSMRPYGFGTLGGTFALMDASIDGAVNPISQPSALTDVTYAFKLGGGFYVPLTHGERSISLDVGSHLRWNGGTRFVDGDRITVGPSGQVILDPTRVTTRALVFSAGVTVGL